MGQALVEGAVVVVEAGEAAGRWLIIVMREMENYVRLKMLIYICKNSEIEILSGAPNKYIKSK